MVQDRLVSRYLPVRRTRPESGVPAMLPLWGPLFQAARSTRADCPLRQAVSEPLGQAVAGPRRTSVQQVGEQIGRVTDSASARKVVNERIKKEATRRVAQTSMGVVFRVVFRVVLRSASSVTFLAMLSACRPDNSRPPAQPAQVSVLAVTPRAIAAHIGYEGQALASKHVDVRSQVTGVIVDRPYVEGVDVPAGALLFKIDPTLYKAAYDNALGQLASAQSRAANAERSFARLRPLLTERAVAQQDVDNAEAALQQARADVQAAQGAVDQAKKNLDDTDVRAQIGGRVGIAQLVLGARVTGTGDVLTTIDQVDPIYVQFNPSDQDVLTWRREIAAKRLAMPGGRLRVRSVLADSTVMPGTGTITFSDITIQQQTGTQTLRATFPNPEHILLPGQFVRVELLDLKRTGAFLVPQRAVQQGVAGSYVYTVTDSNTVAPRNVSASVWEGSAWVIEDGLKVGDRVVVDGIQKVGPGAHVRPVPYEGAADTTLHHNIEVPAPPGTSLTGGRS